MTKTKTETETETQLAELFARYEPALAKLGRALRKKLRARLPGLREIVYLYERQSSLVIAYAPSDRGHEAVCSLALSPEQVKLYFAHGPALAKRDSAKLLRGSGKAVRYVEIQKLADFDRAEIEAFLATVLELAKVEPIAGAQGAVIFKTEEQEKRAARVKKAARSSSTKGAKKARR